MGYSDRGLLCKDLRNADSRSGVFLNTSSLLSQHLLWLLLVRGSLPQFPVCSYLCVTGNPATGSLSIDSLSLNMPEARGAPGFWSVLYIEPPCLFSAYIMTLGCGLW